MSQASIGFFTRPQGPEKEIIELHDYELVEEQLHPLFVRRSSGIVGSYLSMLDIKPVVGRSLVQIRFTTPDPALSTISTLEKSYAV